MGVMHRIRAERRSSPRPSTRLHNLVGTAGGYGSSTAKARLPKRDKQLPQRDQRLRARGLRSLLPWGYGLSNGDGKLRSRPVRIDTVGERERWTTTTVKER